MISTQEMLLVRRTGFSGLGSQCVFGVFLSESCRQLAQARGTNIASTKDIILL